MSSENNNEKRKRYKFKGVLFALCVIGAVFALKAILDNKGKFLEKFGNSVADAIEGEEGKVTTISEVTLDQVFDIQELSTADYTYNAIAKAYDEDGSTVRYYVAYEGRVKAGIDFGKIECRIDKEEKIITITLPEVELKEKTVDPGTMEYIFKDKRSESETVHQEAYQICEADLEEKTKDAKELLHFAEENAAAVVKALVMPWVEQIDADYTVEIR